MYNAGRLVTGKGVRNARWLVEPQGRGGVEAPVYARYHVECSLERGKLFWGNEICIKVVQVQPMG